MVSRGGGGSGWEGDRGGPEGRGGGVVRPRGVQGGRGGCSEVGRGLGCGGSLGRAFVGLWGNEGEWKGGGLGVAVGWWSGGLWGDEGGWGRLGVEVRREL